MDAACVYTCLLLFSEELQYQKLGLTLVFVIVQSLSPVLHFADPWITACQAPLPSTLSQSVLKSVPYSINKLKL